MTQFWAPTTPTFLLQVSLGDPNVTGVSHRCRGTGHKCTAAWVLVCAPQDWCCFVWGGMVYLQNGAYQGICRGVNMGARLKQMQQEDVCLMFVCLCIVCVCVCMYADGCLQQMCVCSQLHAQ